MHGRGIHPNTEVKEKASQQVSGNSVSCSSVISFENMELCTVVDIPRIAIFSKTEKMIPVFTELAFVAVEMSPPLNYFLLITHNTASPIS